MGRSAVRRLGFQPDPAGGLPNCRKQIATKLEACRAGSARMANFRLWPHRTVIICGDSEALI